LDARSPCRYSRRSARGALRRLRRAAWRARTSPPGGQWEPRAVHPRSPAAGWRVVAASVAPTIRRCPALERLLESGARVSSSEDLYPAIAQDVAPIDDIRSSARYRTRVMARVLYHDLRDFWRGARRA